VERSVPPTRPHSFHSIPHNATVAFLQQMLPGIFPNLFVHPWPSRRSNEVVVVGDQAHEEVADDDDGDDDDAGEDDDVKVIPEGAEGNAPADDGGGLSALTCSICLGNVKRPTTTTCGHIYCAKCIKQAIKAVKFCPLCKTPITARNLIRLYS